MSVNPRATITEALVSNGNGSDGTPVNNVTTKHLINSAPTNKLNFINISELIDDLNEALGKQLWIKYAQSVSLFILGKRTRTELVQDINSIIYELDNLTTTTNPNTTSTTIYKLHNQLMLTILANSLISNKNGINIGNGFNTVTDIGNSTVNGNKPNKVTKTQQKQHQTSQIESYKRVVMSLPIQDRKRMSKITREAGKRGFVLCSVLQTRLATLPKIPAIASQETLNRIRNYQQQQQQQQQQPGKGPDNNSKNNKSTKNNVANETIGTPLEWSHEVCNAYTQPLSQELYALPDNENLYTRMVGLARENGLVGTVDVKCCDVLNCALEQYLRNIVESGIDFIRYRAKKYSGLYDLDENGFYTEVDTTNTYNSNGHDVHKNKWGTAGNDNSNNTKDTTKHKEPMSSLFLTNEDLLDTFSLYPNLIEPSSVYYNLTCNYSRNDDEMVIKKSRIDDMPFFEKEKPSFVPVDDRNNGTREELNWLIRNILTNE
ncbi:related to Transcriptional coactivator HFI1/ADA1 [Saccharomycodes ludwigii]|uniref:Related to Transcriptional coactivator HFI1/ADA1 n=1 Tax=Saccharomycodes ludwigii TaxID=36035 RepID=A0A376B2M1_9ASCO|nr:related to Transcriptional coactivator HFI1/ADA1 [Saccharomycodes ludwigii]